MQNIKIVFVLVALLLSSGNAIGSVLPTNEDVKAILQQVIADTNAPSLSVAVAYRNELKVAVAAGFADKGSNVLATPKTKYRTGSIAKVIGTTAFMHLVEQGDVSLKDDIKKYLPYYPQKRWPISIEHILSHTSGIRHYNFGEYGTNTHYPTLQDATTVFRNDALLFEPGQGFRYSTYGINLIQGVIESVSEQVLDDFLAEKLWQPANMKDTQLERKSGPKMNFAVGYRSFMRFMPVSAIDVSNKYIGGGMRSTPQDLVNMVSALNKGKLLNPDTIDLMLTVPFPNASKQQALGWEWIDYKGHKAFSHSGAINGFESYLLHLVEPQITIALMVNRDNYDHTSSTTYKVLDLFLDGHGKLNTKLSD